MTKAFDSCTVPHSEREVVSLAHGSGGRLSWDLFHRVFRPAFADPELDRAADAAVLEPLRGKLALATDAFVVHPLRFRGGSIGDLAVNGTINDLAVSGAIPHYLTASFVVEEGTSVALLEQVVADMARAASRANVRVVAGDTKVVERGHGDEIFIATTGVGSISPTRTLSTESIRPGYDVLVSGPIGDHGVAIVEARGELGFTTRVESDTAPLAELAQVILEVAPKTACMRDPTRGGLATTLNELASAAGVGIEVDQAAVPIRQQVNAACEVLGFDPLYLANEGRLVAIVHPDESEAALDAIRSREDGAGATRIGRVVAEHSGVVIMNTPFGAARVLDMLEGEHLPRIC